VSATGSTSSPTATGSSRTRTYAEVARRVGVSETTIRRVARSDRWEEQLAASNQRAVAKVVRRREERIAAFARIADGLSDHFEENLEAKAAAATFTDLERMAKLVELLMGEATDRVSFSEAQSFVGEVLKLAVKWVSADGSPAERRAGLMAEFNEIVSGMRAIEQRGGA
jgi:hypothetical protein